MKSSASNNVMEKYHTNAACIKNKVISQLVKMVFYTYNRYQ